MFFHIAFPGNILIKGQDLHLTMRRITFKQLKSQVEANWHVKMDLRRPYSEL